MAVLADAAPEAPLGADERQRGRPGEVEERAAVGPPPPRRPREKAEEGGGGAAAAVEEPLGPGQVGHEGGGDEAEEGQLEGRRAGKGEKVELVRHCQIE